MLFFEDFTSPFSTPDLQFTVTIRLRDINSNHNNADVVVEHTGEPTGYIQTFENRSDSLTHDKQNTITRILRPRKRVRKPPNDVSAFLENMSKPTDDSSSFPEYLNVAHELICKVSM